MRFTLQEIINTQTALIELAKEKLPIKVAYRLSKIIKVLEKEIIIIEEQRIALIHKYGTEDEKKNWKVDDSKFEAFQAEYSELLKEEIELDVHPIKLSLLETVTSDVSLLTIHGMDKLIEEEIQ